MTLMFKLCNALHWFALTMWIAALVAAGIAATNTFGRLIPMKLSLTRFPAIPAEEHGRIAAGIVMEGVFFTVDVVQFVAVPLTIATLIAQLLWFKVPLRWPSNVLRSMCMAAAAIVFCYHAGALAPAMNAELRAYWTAAEAGELERIEAHHAAFQQLHPRAELLLNVNLLLLLTALVASAITFTPSSLLKPDGIQQPDLLKRT